MGTRLQGRSTRVGDMGDIGGHLRPHRNRRHLHHPTGHLTHNIGVLSHGRTHFPLGQSMGAGEIQLEGIDTDRLATLDDFVPAIFTILLHDRSDQDPLRMRLLEAIKLLEPDIKRSIADQFDIFPAINFLRITRPHASVARRHVDDFGSIQTDCLGDRSAPAFVEGLANNIRIGAGWPAAYYERIFEAEAVDRCFESWHFFKYPLLAKVFADSAGLIPASRPLNWPFHVSSRS